MNDNPWDRPLPPDQSDLASVAEWVVEQSPTAEKLLEQWADRYWLPGEPAQTVLDVGCGDGAYSVVFAARGVRYTGIDISHAMLRMARERFPKGEFHHGDVTALPFADNSFDLAFTRATLYHLALEDARAAIAEMVRVARIAAIVGLFSILNGKRGERITPLGTRQRREPIGDDLAMMLEFDPHVELRIAAREGTVAEAYFIARKDCYGA